MLLKARLSSKLEAQCFLPQKLGSFKEAHFFKKLKAEY